MYGKSTTSQEERDTPAYQVFHTAFEVCIPQYAAVNADVEKTWGTVQMRDKEYERALSQENVHTLRTIAHLAELHAMGTPIVLVNNDRDAIIIYTLIKKHQQQMANHINREVDFVAEGSDEYYRIQTVVEDMEKLDAFAFAIYPMAKNSLPVASRAISLRSRLNRFAMMDKYTDAQLAQRQPELSAGAPTTLADLLTSSSVTKVRTWGKDEQ